TGSRFSRPVATTARVTSTAAAAFSGVCAASVVAVATVANIVSRIDLMEHLHREGSVGPHGARAGHRRHSGDALEANPATWAMQWRNEGAGRASRTRPLAFAGTLPRPLGCLTWPVRCTPLPAG